MRHITNMAAAFGWVLACTIVAAVPICAKWGRRFLKENATDPNDCPPKGYTMMPTTWLTIEGGDNEFVFSEEG